MAEERNDDGALGVVQESKLEQPPECFITIGNEDATTKDFLVEILQSVFDKSMDEAEKIADTIKDVGSEFIGVYTYDIAMTRAGIASAKAKKACIPLKLQVGKQ